MRYLRIGILVLVMAMLGASASAHVPLPTSADNTTIYTHPMTGSNWSSPMGSITKANVTSGWNQPRPFGVHNHYGTDFGVPSGTNLYATQSGTVVKSYTDACWGKTLIIDHGGVYSRYMHLSSVQVGVGQYVSAGQGVAVSGATGSTDCISGAHLHYEVVTANATTISGTDPQATRTNPTPFFKWIDTNWAGSMAFIKNEKIVSSRYLQADVSATEGAGDIDKSYISVRFWYRQCSTCTWQAINGVWQGGRTYRADMYTTSVRGTVYWMVEGTRTDGDMPTHHNKGWSPGKWRVPDLRGPNNWPTNPGPNYFTGSIY